MIDLKSFDPTDANNAMKAAERANRLEALLLECGRGTHSRGYNEESADYPPCPKSYEDASDDAMCNCGADEWNERGQESVEWIMNEAAIFWSKQRHMRAACGGKMIQEERTVVITAMIAALVEGVRLLGRHGAEEDSLYQSVSTLMDRKAFNMIVDELIEQKTFKRSGWNARKTLVYCGPCMLDEGR